MRAPSLLSAIRPKRRFLFLLVFAILLAACTPGTPSDAEPAEVDREFTLRSESRDGGLVFVGVGGEIDDQVNPTLLVATGERVRLSFINGTGMNHNIAVRELNISSPYVSSLEAETWLDFTVSSPQTLTYFCETVGHATAGMEGQITVQ